MATTIQKQNAAGTERFKHLSRAPYYDQAKHFNDNFLNLGYDYRNKLLQKTTSPELWGNPLQTSLFGRLEGLLTMALEQVKSIKKAFSIAHDSDTTNIN
jgi:hypothetical protein